MTAELQQILQTEECDLDIQAIRFYKNERRVELLLTASGFLLPKRERLMLKKLREALPFVQDITLNIDYKDIDERIKEDFPAAVNMLKAALIDIAYELTPFISMSHWELSDDGIIVKLPEKYTRLMKAALHSIRKHYGIAMRIELSADDEREYDPTLTVIKPEVKDNVVPYAVPVMAQPPKPAPKPEEKLSWGDPIPKTAKIMPLRDIKDEMRSVVVRGRLIPMTEAEQKNKNTKWLKRVITDGDSAILLCKSTFKDDKKTIHDFFAAVDEQIEKKNAHIDIVVRGRAYYDEKQLEYCIDPYGIAIEPTDLREDTAEEKRVELHLHTQMSEMDAIVPVKEAVWTAARWGHKAVAITDHGVVHGFPEAMHAADKFGIKLIFGMEGYLEDDSDLMDKAEQESMRFVSFSASYTHGARGVYNFFELSFTDIASGEEYRTFINPGIPLNKKFDTVTNDDVKNAPSISEVMPAIREFLDGACVVTHDKEAYLSFCKTADNIGVKLERKHVDTRLISHYIYHEADNDTLKDVNRTFSMITNEEPDINRSKTTARLYLKLKAALFEMGAPLPVMHGADEGKRTSYYHIILLAKNREGLKNMYRIVTHSHIESFSNSRKRPLIPRSLFTICREGIILGSACERGELFRAVVAGKAEGELQKIAGWYDFLEIQPIGNNAFMLRNGEARDEEELRDFNRRIVALGEALKKPVAATGDVHFLNPEDGVYRKILMHSMHFKDVEQQAPLYFKTTDEMLEEFSYLGEEKAHEVVIENPNMIAESCESLRAYLDEKKTYAPKFPGADDELRSMAVNKVVELYGDELPEIVKKRLDFELNSIIGNDYATLYLMAQRLVHKSMSDGYLVGSRGSVGSSFVAYLAGITEVNPLPAHYLCPECKHTEFYNTDYACGIDMPEKTCPECGAKYRREGFDIPFEVFLGFKGDKTPDIDLNFSGEYQEHAHEYTREMFGDRHAFRAGTISTLKDKTAFGYVKSYVEDNALEMTSAEMSWLAMGCVGVKKTTGQHAGGMVIVPEEYDVTDFTPLQYPANKTEGKRPITHFDFHAMDDKLVKLDILGHDDPTALKMMHDMTGISPQSVSLDDADTLALFSMTESLGIDLTGIEVDVGALGIPEYGTRFVRGILDETLPTTIEELVRIAGLSHGTDVWSGNAQTLINEGVATLSQVICTRDDIMTFLINSGCESSLAFKIMENVRKGKGLTPEMEQAMVDISIPKWYIDSCKKIKYMFPRAHAAAYLTMAFRVAYYKMHYPEVFYAVYLTVRADDFNIALCKGGTDAILGNLKKINTRINELNVKRGKAAPAKDPELDGMTADKLDKLIPILEIVYEMNMRGIKLRNIDINRSHATRFLIEGNEIIPPFNSIHGLGDNQAEQMQAARDKAPNGFTSIEDFKLLSGASDTLIAKLDALGCFEGMVKSDQLSLLS